MNTKLDDAKREPPYAPVRWLFVTLVGGGVGGGVTSALAGATFVTTAPLVVVFAYHVSLLAYVPLMLLCICVSGGLGGGFGGSLSLMLHHAVLRRPGPAPRTWLWLWSLAGSLACIVAASLSFIVPLNEFVGSGYVFGWATYGVLVQSMLALRATSDAKPAR